MRAKRKVTIKAYTAEGGADYGPALRPRTDGRLGRMGRRGNDRGGIAV
jgi:hypothetical protein